MAFLALAVLTAMIPFSDIPKTCVDAVISAYPAKQIKPDEISMTLTSISDKGELQTASYRGDVSVYPASVVKMFYLGYAAEQLERGKVKLTDEFTRGVTDMIVDSNNDATGFVLDTICGTTPGPELSEKDQVNWNKKRLAVNRWYESRGYKGVNARHRTYNEGPYGRERAAYGPKFELRNTLTTDACARLMAEIMADKMPRSEWMRTFLHRTDPKNGQFSEFMGSAFPTGTDVYSKAGWVNDYRHDVVGFKLPDGRRYAVAVFTTGHGNDMEILQFLAKQLVTELGPKA